MHTNEEANQCVLNKICAEIWKLLIATHWVNEPLGFLEEYASITHSFLCLYLNKMLIGTVNKSLKDLTKQNYSSNITLV